MATLHVVATPIGNLEDLTPRAAAVLGAAPVVAAESVTRAKKLLSWLGLGGKRIISCREANRDRSAQMVLEALDQGQDVALISDAGTPGVSDPGGHVVAQLAHSGHRISPVPGPSALTAAISVAGLPGAPLAFLGFLPAKPGPRGRLLAQARDLGWPFAFFEAPHRVADTAGQLAELMGERQVTATRELTKLHEEIVHTTCAELAQAVNTRESRGEYTILVGGGDAALPGDDEVQDLIRQGLDQGDEPPSRLARRVAKATGRGREEVYRLILAMQKERG